MDHPIPTSADGNTSGHGPAATVPAEIDRWNWGAFLLHWIWGIGNRVWIALLMFVPVVNLVMMVVLGVKGSSWAWRNRRWDSVQQFQQVQRRWARWGAIVWAVTLLSTVALVFGLMQSFKRSEPFRLSLERVQANAEVSALLGQPLSTGWPMGELSVSGPSGSAKLSYGVSGPKGAGTVFVEATKDLGRWRLDRAAFEDDATGRRWDLLGEGGPSDGACRPPRAGCV